MNVQSIFFPEYNDYKYNMVIKSILNPWTWPETSFGLACDEQIKDRECIEIYGDWVDAWFESAFSLSVLWVGQETRRSQTGKINGFQFSQECNMC